MPRGRAASTSLGSDRRYGPFDLRLYADLVTDEPGLRAEDLTDRDSDPYVELRIVRRVGPLLAPWLPAVALLGRFDHDMLALVASTGAGPGGRPGGHIDTDALFAELGAQEWIAAYSDEAGGGGFLEVKPPLQGRLRGYFGHPDRRGQLEPARVRLAAGLIALVHQRPLGKLGVPHLDAALRLGEMHDVIDLWRAVERRIPAEASWGWAFNVTRELLGEGAPAQARGSVLHVAVRSTHAAACLRQQPAARVEEQWFIIEERAFGGSPVLDRARLGQVTCSGRRAFLLADLHPADIWQRLAGWLDPAQAAASVVAAVEGMIERAESERDPGRLVWSVDALARWLGVVEIAGVEPGLLAFASCLQARAAMLAGNQERCRKYLWAVVERSGALPVDRHRDAWLDWREPACLRDRVRLEAVRLLDGNVIDKQTLERWLNEARIDTIDGERLASRAWTGCYGFRAPDPALLRALRPRLAYVPRRRPTCHAHRFTRSLFAVIAEALIRAGDHDAGEALAREHLDAATAAADDPHTVQEAMSLLEMVRRVRGTGSKASAPGGWPAARPVALPAVPAPRSGPAATPVQPAAAAFRPRPPEPGEARPSSQAPPPEPSRVVPRGLPQPVLEDEVSLELLDDDVPLELASDLGAGEPFDPALWPEGYGEDSTAMGGKGSADGQHAARDAQVASLLLSLQPKGGYVQYRLTSHAPTRRLNELGERFMPEPTMRYEMAIMPMDGALGKEIDRLDRDQTKLDLAMRMTRELAAYPWEGYLAMGNLARREWLNAYRTSPPGRSAPGAHTWQQGEVRLIAPRAWRAALAAPWQGRARVTTSPDPAGPPCRVVHLVGRAIQTASGVRLRVGDSSVPSEQAESPGRGNTLSARDLRVGGSWLAIVQAEPVDGLHRGPLEREESYHLRDFAADVFNSEGAHAVLMLPALPADAAQAALAALAGALHADRPPRAAELVAAVHAVRRVVAGALGVALGDIGNAGSEEARWEMTFDVTLFVREERIP